MRTAAVAIALGLLASPRGAEAQDVRELRIVVAAGKHDRKNTPVTVALGEATAGSVTLRDAGGRSIPAQLTAPSILAGPGAKAELHFVLPELKAGSTAEFTASIRAGEGAAARGWTSAEGRHAEFAFDGRPVFRYVHDALDESSKEARERTYKVFHHVYDPSGKRTVTNGAGGFYPHHRGLFYGWSKVTYGAGRSCNIWGCNGDAHQAHDRFARSEGGAVVGRHAVEIRWHGAGKDHFAQELREVGAYNVPGGNLVEFASELRALLPPLKLDGDPQHAGFHFRADNEVNERTKAQTVYVRPDGAGKPGETRNWPGVKTHADLPWLAMSFVLGEKRYTAAYLDRPDNPKEARFSERDYGRFGSYFVAELDGKKPLRVRYRVWLQEGQMTPEELAAKSADFVDPPAVSVR